MIAQIPKWVWPGVWVLASVAGIINVVGLLGFGQQAITHLTGNSSMFAAALANGDGAAAMHFAAMLLAFMLGCVLSGVLIHDGSLQLGRRYGVALLMASALLFAAVPLLEASRESGVYLAACACGLLNAMVTTYSGAVVRTTHLSGMFTDLGLFLGHALRGKPIDHLRLRLCLLVISGFVCGGVIGAWSFARLHSRALWIPAVTTLILAMLYHAYRQRHLAELETKA